MPFVLFCFLSTEIAVLEKPTKCTSSRKLIDVNAQVQFIDFEGRSDGESLFKILSQLRPRRVVVIRGSTENIDLVAKHCSQNIGARVFTPHRGDIVDATTETHIYQVKLTEALVTQLQFQKGKDAEVAWIDAQVLVRNKKVGTVSNGDKQGEAMDVDQNDNDDITDVLSDLPKVLTLEPIPEDKIPAHNSVFINELKLSDFKQILQKNNIPSEFSGGTLWCSNSTLAIRRVGPLIRISYRIGKFNQNLLLFSDRFGKTQY